MTEEELAARIIISRWIHKVTGTSEAERGMRQAREALLRLGQTVGESLIPWHFISTKWDK